MTEYFFCEDLLADSIPIITVNHRGAARLRGGHLWVYRSDLVPPVEAPAGSLVHVHDQRGRGLGSALYSSASQIAIRLLTNDAIGEPELLPLLHNRIAQAVEFRRQMVRDSDSYRVIFSEADLLPGLIVDKYNDVLTLQALTQAFDRERFAGGQCWIPSPSIFPEPTWWSASMRTSASWSSYRPGIRSWFMAIGPARSSP